MLNMNRVAGAILALLACALLADASATTQRNVVHKISGKGLAKLRADVKAGKVFPEKILVVGGASGNGTIESTQAVCGADTSVFSSFKNVCKMTFIASDGNTYVCSAWLIARNKLGTAGHCIVDNGGYIQAAMVKCGAYTKDVTFVVTTAVYYKRVFTDGLGEVHWSDAAVLKVGTNFPTGAAYAPYKFRLAPGCTTKKTVTVAGYPAQSGVFGCHYNGIQQWKSRGSLTCALRDGFYPSDIDSCGGGSGSRVVDADNYAIGIFVAQVTRGDSCVTNYVTKILDPNGTGNGVYMQPMIDALG